VAINMTFIDFTTIIPSDWLNNVNGFVNYTFVNSVAQLRTSNHLIVTRIITTGYYSNSFNGAAAYVYDPSDTTSADNGGTIIVASDGARWKLYGQDVVNAYQFGAKFDGSTDDTVAIQKAVATGLPVELPAGTSVLTQPITCATKGQRISGKGRTTTIFNISSSFNLTAQGVFVVTSGEVGPVFEDFGVLFVQPDTNIRANLTVYPPAFYAYGQPRTRFQGLRITAGTHGIDIRGNSGGSDITECEFACFTTNIWIDGSLDSMKIDRCHIWNFSLTANQSSIFTDTATLGINTGRCDDLHVTDTLLLVGTGITTYTGAISGLGGNTFGEITNCDFDTTNGINQTGGWLTVTGSTFTQASTNNYAITGTANGVTYMMVANCLFSAAVVLTTPQISVTGNLFTLTLTGCQFHNVNNVPIMAASGNADILVSNSVFTMASNSSVTNPVVSMASGSFLTFIGNRFPQGRGSGSGNVITLASDGPHVLTGNDFGGWGISFPGSYTSLIFRNNANGPASVINRIVTGTRALSTTYTNNNNLPILLNVTMNGTTAGNLVGYVGGNQITIQGVATGSYGTLSYLVPEQATYQVTFSGTGSLAQWVETY